MSAPIGLVTGAGSGIGQATALRLAARGLHVVVVGRTQQSLDETCRLIDDRGGSAEAQVADCGSPADLDRLVAAIGERPVQVLVHNAGHHVPQTFMDTTRDAFDAQVAVNLAGPFFLTQALRTRLVPGAGIVFVGSITAARARDHHIAYAMTKAGMVGLTIQLAAELAPDVRVNCVSPGSTRTGMLDSYVQASTADRSDAELKQIRAADRSRILLRRIAEPDEVAATIEHLALDATAMTGVEVPVDVGYRAS